MATKLRVESWDVITRLAEIGFTRDELIDVVKMCVAQHAYVSENDPPNAKGYEPYRFAVRGLRDIKIPKQEGWNKDNSEGYCTLINEERHIRIAVMNSDSNTGKNDHELVPQNRSKKGLKSGEVSKTNEKLEQQLVLGGVDWAPIPDNNVKVVDFSNYTTWHLCIFISGEEVRCELSRLHGFDGSFYTQCFERIIILGVGDWDKPNNNKNNDEDDGQEFDVEITRK